MFYESLALTNLLLALIAALMAAMVVQLWRERR